jgi:hypothetical protein
VDVDYSRRGFWWTWIIVDVDSGGRGFWWTSGFTRRVFYRDVPAVTGPVPLHRPILLLKYISFFINIPPKF